MSNRIKEAEELLAAITSARRRVGDLAEGRVSPDTPPSKASVSPPPESKPPATELPAPEAHLPEVAAPEEPAPEVAAPEEPAPEVAAPEEPAPEVAVPEATDDPDADDVVHAPAEVDPYSFFDHLAEEPEESSPVSEAWAEEVPSADFTPADEPDEEPVDERPISHEPPPRRPQPLPAHPALAVAAPPVIRQPRPVQARLHNPDGARLEVDWVAPDPLPLAPEPVDPVVVPQLTDPNPHPTSPAARAPIHQPEAAFDWCTEANQALARGELGLAITRFSDVLDLEPSHIGARLGRGRCHRDQGDHAAAASDFLRAQDHAPHAPEPWVEMADLFFARKDYEEAIQLYSHALEREPSHAMAHCRRGICHHYRRRPDPALADLHQAKQLDPAIPNIDRYIQMVSRT